MTHLGQVLLKHCDLQKTKPGDMAARMKIQASVISNLKLDRQFYLDFKTLQKIYIGISTDQSVRNEVLVAYLADIRDNLPSLDSSKINIQINQGARRVKDEPKSLADRYASIMQALMDNEVRGNDLDLILFLASHISKDPNLRQTINNIVQIIKR